MMHVRLAQALLGTCLACLLAAPAAAQSQVAWEQWQHEVGIVDVAARSDGTLVAMIAGRLFLIPAVGGSATPFANGPDGWYFTDRLFHADLIGDQSRHFRAR